MIDIRKEEKDILEKVKQIKKGFCPNFYLTGISISLLEQLALQMAEVIEEEKLITFKGIVTYFTIKMPYYDEEKGAINFLNHLKESVSIAADCYDYYRGMVLIEMSEKWNEKGPNKSLHLLLNYLQANQEICFILIVPLTESCKYSEELFCEYSRCGIWMRIQAKTPTVSQCVQLFEELAREEGYKVTTEAKKKLEDKLVMRKETQFENAKVVQQLIQQIVFNRSMINKDDKIIGAADIVGIAGIREKNHKNTIGFAADLR